MPVRYEAGSCRADFRSQHQEAIASPEHLTVPTDIPSFETSTPRAHQEQTPIREPGTMVFASNGSTRWTKGRGNKPLGRRLAGAAAGVIIAIPVMFGRGFIYGLQGAADGVRRGAALATGILKDMHPIPRIICALPLLVLGLGGGAVVGAVYGATRGFFGAVTDVGKGIISELTGGNANYFAIANRKYRD